MKELKLKKYKGSIILKISLVALVIFVVGILLDQQVRINSMRAELNDYDSKIAVQQIANDKIRESMDDSKYDVEEFSEDYARSEFDYAKENEKVFINIGGN